MGFGHGQSERAVRLYGTVHAALDALLAGKGNDEYALMLLLTCEHLPFKMVKLKTLHGILCRAEYVNAKSNITYSICYTRTCTL